MTIRRGDYFLGIVSAGGQRAAWGPVGLAGGTGRRFLPAALAGSSKRAAVAGVVAATGETPFVTPLLAASARRAALARPSRIDCAGWLQAVIDYATLTPGDASHPLVVGGVGVDEGGPYLDPAPDGEYTVAGTWSLLDGGGHDCGAGQPVVLQFSGFFGPNDAYGLRFEHPVCWSEAAGWSAGDQGMHLWIDSQDGAWFYGQPSCADEPTGPVFEANNQSDDGISDGLGWVAFHGLGTGFGG